MGVIHEDDWDEVLVGHRGIREFLRTFDRGHWTMAMTHLAILGLQIFKLKYGRCKKKSLPVLERLVAYVEKRGAFPDDIELLLNNITPDPCSEERRVMGFGEAINLNNYHHSFSV